MSERLQTRSGVAVYDEEDLIDLRSACSSPFPSMSELSDDGTPYNQADGATDNPWMRGRPVGAVFVHAGAGYHSLNNESIHLDACNEAARVAMRFIKAGATAVDAVEAAIRVLENKEITNAGYGSNLTIDGMVECDATIVDHLGRSGGCGAVPNVKNPISLAKSILVRSARPLSLRRIPPNFLVSLGAREFARNEGLPIVDNDVLVSSNARDRFLRWRDDLARADELEQRELERADSQRTMVDSSSTHSEQTSQSQLVNQPQFGSPSQRDHVNAILTGTWNEGQPDSPFSPSPRLSPASGSSGSGGLNPMALIGGLQGRVHQTRPPMSATNSDSSVQRLAMRRVNQSGSRLQEHASDGAADEQTEQGQPRDVPAQEKPNNAPGNVTARGGSGTAALGGTTVGDYFANCAIDTATYAANTDVSMAPVDDDVITDTVGAIVVDLNGNIAAGSSSGGIGMKHSGRVGPAAQVNIGTAVIPADMTDPQGVSVAAVTSGTGEHMGTTAASLRCAERLHQNSRRGLAGRDMREEDDDAAIESFVTNDFMGHPGVTNACSAGALGVMAVKRSRSGIYFYFGHNTDSFALASFSTNERIPRCVMSRVYARPSNQSIHNVTRGGRKISF